MTWAWVLAAWFAAAFTVIASLRWLARAVREWSRKRAMPKRERVHLSRAEKRALRHLSAQPGPGKKRADKGAP
jgi:hypothetical protein